MVRFRTLTLVRRHIASFYRHNTWRKMKNLLSVYRQYWTGKPKIKGYPFEIIIDPANACNLQCPLCVTGQRRNTRPLGQMAFEDFCKIIDDMGDWLYKVRFYSWGEPLMHKDIYKMIAYATEKNIGTELSSNFTVFKPEDAETLIASGLEMLIVSLDGASPATYATYRRGGDFERVLGNIRALMEAKARMRSRSPLVEAQFLVMKHNEHEIGAMKQLAKELGVDRLRIAPVTVNTKDSNQARKWLPVNEKWSRYDYRTWEDQIYRKRKRCEWLWRSAVVNWDGTISPCCVFEGPKTDFGSLREHTFSNIWNNQSYQSARNVFSQTNGNTSDPGKPTICSICKGRPHAGSERQQGLY